MRFKMYYSPGATVVYDPVTANLFNAHYSPIFTGQSDDIGHASNFAGVMTYIKELYDWKKVIEIKYIDEDELYVVTLQDKRAMSPEMRGMLKTLKLIVIPEQSKYFNFDLLNEDNHLFSIFRTWAHDNRRR